MKLHIQEPANGYTVRHVSITDEQGNPVCRIDWQGSVKETNDLAMKITELWQQRDELLAAVQYAADVFSGYVDTHKAMGDMGAEAQGNQQHLQVMLEAIAKAGGES